MRAKFINESLNPEEKREMVMQILSDRNIKVPHDSYVRFFDLSSTDLTPEEIVDELVSELHENVQFERGRDPKSQMGVGIKNYHGYIILKLKEMFPDKDPHF